MDQNKVVTAKKHAPTNVIIGRIGVNTEELWEQR